MVEKLNVRTFNQKQVFLHKLFWLDNEPLKAFQDFEDLWLLLALLQNFGLYYSVIVCFLKGCGSLTAWVQQESSVNLI